MSGRPILLDTCAALWIARAGFLAVEIDGLAVRGAPGGLATGRIGQRWMPAIKNSTADADVERVERHSVDRHEHLARPRRGLVELDEKRRCAELGYLRGTHAQKRGLASGSPRTNCPRFS